MNGRKDEMTVPAPRGEAMGRITCSYATAVALAMLTLTSAAAGALICSSDISSASDVETNVSLEIIGPDGKILTSSLMEGSAIIFNTDTDCQGNVSYTLSSGVTIDNVPAGIFIRADGGTYNVTVSMEGLSGTWMDQYGIRMNVGEGYADLNASNGYSSCIGDGTSELSLAPGTPYLISLETLGGSSTDVDPGTINDITVKFTWSASEDTHIVVLVIDGERIVIPVSDGYFTPEVPSKRGYELVCWEDQAGNRYDGGVPIAVHSDMVLTAQWRPLFPWPEITCIIMLIGISLYIMVSFMRGGGS